MKFRSKLASPRVETFLFQLVLALHLLPILVLTPFLTVDGPAHLYNAVLIRDLLLDSGDRINAFFELNPFPEPNWIGHLILTTLSVFLPALICEKVLQLLILVGFATAFRSLSKAIEDQGSAWSSWLVFPFLYNYPFLLGFYNFSIGLTITLAFTAWWIKRSEYKISVRRFWVLFIYFLLVYFSHPLIFFLAFAMILSSTIIDKRSGYHQEPPIKKIMLIVLSALPGIVFLSAFAVDSGLAGYTGKLSSLSYDSLLNDLLYSRMLIGYDAHYEKHLTILFSLLTLLVFLFCVFKWKKSDSSPLLGSWILGALLFYWVLPDEMFAGGFISVRLLLIFFLFVHLWFSTVLRHSSLLFGVIMLSTLFSFRMIKLHFSMQSEAMSYAEEYLSPHKRIEKNSVILPLNYSTNPLHCNLASYLGALQSAVVLDNYEANSGSFPVLWKPGMNPELHMGNHSSSKAPCVDILYSEKATGFPVNYLIGWRPQENTIDSCHTAVKRQIDSLFVRSGNEEISLFVRKTNL